MRRIFFLLLWLCLPAVAGASDVEIRRNPDTGLLIWKAQDPDLSLELIQLHPDFIRAIYESRGFPKEMIEVIAGYCVFGTIIKNLAETMLSYRVADWYYVDAEGNNHHLKTKSQWMEEWKQAGVPFMWSMLPDEQDFDVGDWNQGFTTVDLPRESAFDLIFTWTTGGKSYQGRIDDLTCAPEHLPGREP
jgi:hypothetical protein